MMGLGVGQYKIESSIPRTLTFARLPSWLSKIAEVRGVS